MLSFQWPWMLLLLPIPWLIRRILPVVETPTQSALKVPFLQDLYQLRQAETSSTPPACAVGFCARSAGLGVY